MNAIKELRKTTSMSQSKFAGYLGIPVANIQHWEQGVSNPPSYLISLISRVMRYDGYIDKSLSVQDIDAIRQTQATLSMEGLFLEPSDISDFEKLATGKISREEFQEMIKEKYQKDEL